MARNIKQVSHDLMPIINTICDLSQDVNAMLHSLYKKIDPKGIKEREHFELLLAALESLNASSTLAQKYIEEVDAEAEAAGIGKSY